MSFMLSLIRSKSGRFGVFGYLPLICLCVSANAAEIVASVDRNPVSLNESFQIIFTAEATPDGEPDFKPLTKDFDILNQSQSTRSALINGTFSKTVQWKLNVMARHAGTLIIPAITFGDDSSRPLALTVTEEGDAEQPDLAGKDLFLEVQASPENPYVQAQVIYTLRFYRRVDITQASLNEPETADALIEKLGEDANYKTLVGGFSYHVTERKYAIFPQKSGTLHIPPLTLDAEVVTSGPPRFNGFFNRQLTRTKRVSSPPATLEVRPVPADYQGHWLPAEGLSLTQEWSGDVRRMKVGEPLTRTLTLVAKSATVGQLPELHQSPDQIDLKSYPDQPMLKEDKKTDGLVAYRQEKIALIASKSGRYTLPAIEVPWFNIRTGEIEVAKIPATTLEVLAGAETKAASTGRPPAQAVSEPEASDKFASASIPSQSPNYWAWLSGFLAIGWLITLIYLFNSGRRKPETPPTDAVDLSLRESVKALRKACQDNDARAAKDALIRWGRLKFNVGTLGALAPLCDARFRDEILRLNQWLYGKQTDSWQGKQLFQYFVENNKAMAQMKKDDDDSLEPLYRL